MSRIELQHSKKAVRRAGDLLASNDAPTKNDETAAVEIMDNWRATHSEALNSAQMGLRSRLGTLGAKGDVSQRLKRRHAILKKLRFEPTANLDTMHDIAGCRAVVDGGLASVRELASQWHRTARRRVRKEYDYISTPRPTGYRGIHLIVEYGPRLVEVQLRTPAQHAWAVAVEDISNRTGHDLKNGVGPEHIVQLLLRMSHLLADFEERGTSLDELDLSALVRILD